MAKSGLDHLPQDIDDLIDTRGFAAVYATVGRQREAMFFVNGHFYISRSLGPDHRANVPVRITISCRKIRRSTAGEWHVRKYDRSIVQYTPYIHTVERSRVMLILSIV